MRLSHQIVLASSNPDKVSEFKALFRTYPEIEIIPADAVIRNADKLGFVETYSTYLENAAAKARVANMASHYPSLADDTGLEVLSLEGKPGVHSFRYAKIKGKSLSRVEQNRANNELLLSELKGKTGTARQARFVTTLALMIEGILVHSTGVLEGTILENSRGENGFGYDCLFQPKDSLKSLAEMSDNEKNAVSHRAKAVQELMVQVKSRGIAFVKP